MAKVFCFGSVALILELMRNAYLRDEKPRLPKFSRLPEMQFEGFHFPRIFCGRWPERKMTRTLSDNYSL
jgi:hypothetical protein